MGNFAVQTYKPAQYAFVEDIITRNDPNKSVEKCTSIEIHNQGSTIVTVNHKVLLPDDRLEINAPPGGEFPHQVFRIRFGAAYPFVKPLSDYPHLSSGNKLVFSTIERIDVL